MPFGDPVVQPQVRQVGLRLMAAPGIGHALRQIHGFGRSKLIARHGAGAFQTDDHVVDVVHDARQALPLVGRQDLRQQHQLAVGTNGGQGRADLVAQVASELALARDRPVHLVLHAVERFDQPARLVVTRHGQVGEPGAQVDSRSVRSSSGPAATAATRLDSA